MDNTVRPWDAPGESSQLRKRILEILRVRNIMPVQELIDILGPEINQDFALKAYNSKYKKTSRTDHLPTEQKVKLGKRTAVVAILGRWRAVKVDNRLPLDVRTVEWLGIEDYQKETYCDVCGKGPLTRDRWRKRLTLEKSDTKKATTLQSSSLCNICAAREVESYNVTLPTQGVNDSD